MKNGVRTSFISTGRIVACLTRPPNTYEMTGFRITLYVRNTTTRWVDDFRFKDWVD
jgi:hypothetical protein